VSDELIYDLRNTRAALLWLVFFLCLFLAIAARSCSDAQVEQAKCVTKTVEAEK